MTAFVTDEKFLNKSYIISKCINFTIISQCFNFINISLVITKDKMNVGVEISFSTNNLIPLTCSFQKIQLMIRIVASSHSHILQHVCTGHVEPKINFNKKHYTWEERVINTRTGMEIFK